MVLSDKPGLLGVVGTVGQQAVQGVASEVKKTAENTVEQLGMKEKKEAVTKTAVTPEVQKQQSKEAVDWLYGAVETPKLAEELQQQQQLGGKLHQEYYQNLTNPSQGVDTEKRLRQAQEEQETTQQRMERLKLEDLSKKREDEKKKEPVAVDMAQNMEKHRGSSG